MRRTLKAWVQRELAALYRSEGTSVAAGVYLLTTTAWTLAERAFVQRALAARAGR